MEPAGPAVKLMTSAYEVLLCGLSLGHSALMTGLNLGLYVITMHIIVM